MIELSTLQVAVFKCGYVMRRTAQNCNRRFRLAFTQKLLSSLAVLSKLCGGTAHHDKSPSLKNPISMTIRAWIQWRRRGEGGKPRHCIAGYSLRLMVPEQGKREKAKTHVSVVWGRTRTRARAAGLSVSGSVVTAYPNSFSLLASSDSGPTFYPINLTPADCG